MALRSRAWGFNQVRLIAGLGIFVILLVVGLGFHVPQYKGIYAAAKEHGDHHDRAKRLIGLSFIMA